MSKLMTLKITERGWAGHFIAQADCRFRRNSLIEFGNKKIVVSTVGNWHPKYANGNEPGMIGWNRYYETMAFKAHKDGVYWEADVEKEILFDSNWMINHIDEETDLKANDMHEAVVKEISAAMKAQKRSPNSSPQKG